MYVDILFRWEVGLMIQAFGVNMVTIKYPKSKVLVYCNCQVVLFLFLIIFFREHTLQYLME